MRPRQRNTRTVDRTRKNHAIRVPEIRCVDEDGGQIGVISTSDALKLAGKRGLDLVEISPRAKPPVCRIMDYGKYKYDQEKKERQAKKHQHATKLKEIKFHANVAEHDYQTKLRHARDFLEAGHRVKFSLYFRGRENAHRELGFELMNKAGEDCKDIGIIEQTPRMMGRTLLMLVYPDPKAKPKQKDTQKDAEDKNEKVSEWESSL